MTPRSVRPLRPALAGVALAALAACSTPSRPRYAVDEARLPAAIRFQPSDRDPAHDVCTSLGANVNSRWQAANPVPADRAYWGGFALAAERALDIERQLAEQAAADPAARGVDRIVGDYYAAGMDQAAIDRLGLSPLAPRLARIDALRTPADVAAYVRESFARGEPVLFDFGPSPDFKDSTRNIAYASQGGLGLPERGYYLDADKRDKLQAYRGYVERLLTLAGAAAAAAGAQADAVVAFETRLARASRSQEELARDVSLYYHPVTLQEADALTPAFPWSAFFAAQRVAAPATFSLSMPAFHREVDAMLRSESVATWQAYLRTRLLDANAPYLDARLEQAHFDFHGTAMAGQKQMRPRWQRVLRALDGQAGQTMGQLYVRTAYPAQSQRRMEQLVANLRTAFGRRLERNAWMSPATRARAQEKLAAFTPKIGHPQRWQDWSGLATTRASWYDTVAATNAYVWKRELAKIGQPVDRSEWSMPPQMVNAYYNPQANEIVFPAAILQPPFFDAAADDATNYGAIGAVIGHEMTHGFDEQGSRFDARGGFDNWWQPEDAARFKALTDRMVAQFGRYEAMPGVPVNGSLTLSENIADLGGLAIAWDAFQIARAGRPAAERDARDAAGMTAEQRFFAAWATAWRSNMRPETLRLRASVDTHAPDAVRADAAPSNMAEFARAWACPADRKMVRPAADRITIW